LEACKQKALASTVREKISDAKLYSAVEDVVEKTPELSKTPFRSRFDVLLAASAMLSGYKVGVVRGLEVTMAVPAAQKGACRAAIEEAEEIVKR
jgi:CRISPR/Cas system-associated endonuclease Cas3-HD